MSHIFFIMIERLSNNVADPSRLQDGKLIFKSHLNPNELLW